MNKEVFDDIGRVISGAADTVSRKTGELVEVARLKNQIFNLEREIKRDYADLGKMIYEQYLERMNPLHLSVKGLPEKRFW